jgi:single-strand DNA-binding protein
MDLNKVMIIGNVTADPQSRTTPQGQNVCSFSVATNLIWTDQSGQKQQRPEFHNIVAWRKLADICAQYLNKGKKVYIEGRLQTRNWEGQDGVKRYRTEIVADNMIMLSGGRGGSEQSMGGKTASSDVQIPTVQLDADAEAPAKKSRGKQAATVAAGKDSKSEVSDDQIQIEDIPF